MGCGCRKSSGVKPRQLSASQLEKIRLASAKRAAEVRLQQKKQIKQNQIAPEEMTRRQQCSSCPNRFIRHENNVDMEMCGKSNRAIFMIVKDLGFACPIQRFSAVK